ncbi:SDR family NAD(P)-dependent oxidoreductase [Frigidibacter sp. ROC022]|uniref:SDR family NAD(P)-dependent oxidoreductase n=1 Tax=Frigidibacter sp. ROC022 TaxID=2971796 RepID=UPI00215A2229|nr:SDR family NAD(P)-dependent oxidoreductase [Frigidibacter sp. ROC022]MCR8722947.1 SDR family NAD(P)-dependent oxidoreductase [Frigidibacter sp. ROC022]
MQNPACQAGNLAVVTGGAAGIGLAAACRFGALGMRVALLDLGAERLEAGASAVRAAGAPEVTVHEVDVTDSAALEQAADGLGPVSVLMANAGIQPGSSLFGPAEEWERVLDVNLGGVIRTVRAFVPGMIAAGRDGAVIVTGSKQGITTPPGDPAYNVSKSGVKTFTEALEHDLRNREGNRITAHLLIPGFVYTDLTRKGRTEKPSGAWTPEQTAAFMMDSLERGDFYILCPDNDVDRALDEKRIAWAAGDIIENRPPLSRWHKDYAEAFAAFLKS